MTTNTTPADHGRRPLEADDPAELLAETRLSLHAQPSDCLIVVGCGASGSAPMLTSSSLRDLLAPEGAENLVRHLGLMRERGSRWAHVLVVIGDGYQDVLEPIAEEIMLRAGEVLHAAAAVAGDAAPELRSVRGAASGRCWSLRFGPGTAAHPVQEGSLREFADTRAAASAVLVGRPLPQPRLEDPLLARIGSRLELPAGDLASAADPGRLFAAARTALAELRSGGTDLDEPASMTKCEQLSALLAAVAVDRLHWELLAQCVERGSEGPIDRETLLQTLVTDRQWRPDPDVCAGGSWYVGLEEIRSVAAAAWTAAPPSRRGTARSAWRGLTTLLVLLAWWNHRFATAGDLVDELREEEPHSTLAPLLSRMTDTPIFPAWWPTA